MFKRSWVRIPTADTGWTHFFTLNCFVCLIKTENESKVVGNEPLKTSELTLSLPTSVSSHVIVDPKFFQQLCRLVPLLDA